MHGYMNIKLMCNVLCICSVRKLADIINRRPEIFVLGCAAGRELFEKPILHFSFFVKEFKTLLRGLYQEGLDGRDILHARKIRAYRICFENLKGKRRLENISVGGN
jgi:hypothetical protein